MSGILIAIVCGILSAVPNIAVLKSSDLSAYNDSFEGLRDVLENVDVHEYVLEGEKGKGEGVIEEMLQTQPKVVVSIGAKAGELCSRKIQDIPIVFTMVNDLEKYGLMKKNITGVLMEVSPESQFAIVRSVFPFLKNVGVIYDPSKTGRMIQEGKKAAKKAGFILVASEVRSRGEVGAVVNSILKTIEALWIVPDSTVVSEESVHYLLTRTLEVKVPVIAYSEDYVKAGAFMAIFPDYIEMGREAGKLVKKIIGGGKPGNIPPVRLTGDVAFNISTSKALGLIIPEAVKARARVY